MSEFLDRFPKPRNITDAVSLAVWERQKKTWHRAMSYVYTQAKYVRTSAAIADLLRDELKAMENEQPQNQVSMHTSASPSGG